MKTVTIGEISVSNTAPFALIAGPCQLESLDHGRAKRGELRRVHGKIEPARQHREARKMSGTRQR